MSAARAPYLVVVGIDYSPASELALERAFELAERQPNAQMHVILVGAGSEDEVQVGEGDTGEKLSADLTAKKLRQYVEEELKRLQSKPSENIEHVVTHLGIGDPATQITELAAELQADLLVVGTHGRGGLRKLVLGSVADKVVRMAHAPVLIVRPKDYSDEPSVPKIEASCSRCAEVRARTAGKELWCEQHSEVHGRRHSYHFARTRGAHNSGFLIGQFKP